MSEFRVEFTSKDDIARIAKVRSISALRVNSTRNSRVNFETGKNKQKRDKNERTLEKFKIFRSKNELANRREATSGEFVQFYLSFVV